MCDYYLEFYNHKMKQHEFSLLGNSANILNMRDYPNHLMLLKWSEAIILNENYHV